MYAANIEALKCNHPDLASLLRDNSDDINYQIVKTNNGNYNILLTKDQSEIFVHNRYNPEREARKISNSIKNDLNEFSSILILGWGLGYHIQELYNSISSVNEIFILIDKLSFFKESLNKFDFVDIFKGDNVHLIHSENKNISELIDEIGSKIDIIFGDMKQVFLPSFMKYTNYDRESIFKEINLLKTNLKTNKKTINKRGYEWEKNLLDNLYFLWKNPGIDSLKNVFKKEIPAVVVSSGPSLNKNIDLLHQIKGKGVIITVDGSLKPLLNKNIIPDIVVTYDGYKHTLKYFENIDYNRLHDTMLFTPPQFYNRIIKKWPGRVIFSPSYSIGEGIISWLEDYSWFKGRILTGGSVAHLAFGAAYHMGANPIVFVGQDLAFSGKSTHVDGCDFNKNIKNELTRKKEENQSYLKIEDIDGNKVLTRADFYLYLKWFNKMIKKIKDEDNEINIIDATEGGARIEGTEIMKLKRVIEDFCQKPVDIKNILLNKPFA